LAAVLVEELNPMYRPQTLKQLTLERMVAPVAVVERIMEMADQISVAAPEIMVERHQQLVALLVAVVAQVAPEEAPRITTPVAPLVWDYRIQ